jgi:DNA-binding beta-propeller fold protein YncE
VPDWTPQTYDEPYLAVDPASGHVLATDPQQHRVLVFTKTGHTVGAITSPVLSLPIGVALQPGSRIAVSDAEANKLNIMEPKTAGPSSKPSAKQGASTRGVATRSRSNKP